MQQTANKRFRFIPYRKHDIVEMCLQEGRLCGQEERFRQVHGILDSIFHFEFHRIIEALKDTYAPIDPDSDTRSCGIDTPQSKEDFTRLLGELLNKANYERVSEAELNQALKESSLFKIRLHVDFDDFSEALIFSRGESVQTETIKSCFGLFSKTIEFINYERVVVYIRFKQDDATRVITSATCRPGSTLLRLFQNVPKADLEMLFPNTQVRMRTQDKLLIGVPAVISGGLVLSTKLGTSLLLLASLVGFWLGMSSEPVALDKTALLALFAGFAALGGYLWKQFSNFKNRKLRFMQTLTQNLYFKNLDNNAGVFHRLANDAEEEECKEAILAYYFLLVSEQPLSIQELDQRIEDWLANKWDCAVDFEIDDALNKLREFGLVDESEEKFSAISLDLAIQKLDQRWDDYFLPSLNA